MKDFCKYPVRFCPKFRTGTGVKRCRVVRPAETKRNDMRDDQRQFLTLLDHWPARLNVEQTAWVLNIQTHDVPELVTKRLLLPLGNPPRSGVKYFATLYVLELARDVKWLAKMTNAIHEKWREKNSRRDGGLDDAA